MADTEELFIPMHSGLFGSPTTSPQAFEQLLMSIPTWFAEASSTQSVVSVAIAGGLAALSSRGGQIFLFQAALPHDLPPQPNEIEVYDTNKECKLSLPRDPIWSKLGEECAQEGIGVTAFFGVHKYVDIGSMGAVVSATGGEVFFHPKFYPAQDGPVLRAQLHDILQRETGYNCIARVRCSKGR